MSFQMMIGRTVKSNVKRMASEQVAKVAASLRDAGAEEVEARVHKARKRFKKVRALVRVCRDGLGKKTARRANHQFRDAGRLLSDVRDADVLLITLDSLIERSTDAGHPEVVDRVRQALIVRKQEARCRVLESGNHVKQVLEMMEEAEKNVKGWKFKKSGWNAIEGGLKRIYQNGRDAFLIAKDATQEEALHEWRKRVKDLLYALQILNPVNPAELSAQSVQAQEIADLLGAEHDLAVLRQTLREIDEVRCGCLSSEALLPLIDNRRKQLQLAAFALGPALYREKPGTFIKRMKESWKNPQHENAV